jgi:serine/threonine-protein kinase
MNPLDPREVPTARKRSWPPPPSEADALGAAKRDSLHESLVTLLRSQRTAGRQAPLAIVSRVVTGMLRRIPSVHVSSDAPSDIYGATVVLWESLAGRAFPPGGPDEVPPPSRYREGLDPAIDAMVAKGLASEPAPHFDSAGEMAVALEAALPPATPSQIGAWVESLASESYDSPAMRAAALPAAVQPAEVTPRRAPGAPVPAEPSIQISVQPGPVAMVRMDVVTRRVRSSRPPPPQVALSFGSLRGRSGAIVSAVLAGSALLGVVCVRYAGGDRAAPSVEGPATVARNVASSASAQATASSSPPVDPAPVAPAPSLADFAAPTGSAAPRAVSSAAPSRAPSTPSAPSTPKAKHAPRNTRDDVL